jgi:hypothetical protein
VSPFFNSIWLLQNFKCVQWDICSIIPSLQYLRPASCLEIEAGLNCLTVHIKVQFTVSALFSNGFFENCTASLKCSLEAGLFLLVAPLVLTNSYFSNLRASTLVHLPNNRVLEVDITDWSYLFTIWTDRYASLLLC